MINLKNRFAVFFLTIIFVTFFSVPLVHAEEDQSDDSATALATGAITKGLAAAQESLSNKQQAINERLVKKVQDLAEQENDAAIVMEKLRYRDTLADMPEYFRTKAIMDERALSGVLTEDTRRTLDEVNYKVLQGYRTIPNVGLFEKENPYLGSRLSAVSKLYELHVKLFCNPEGMTNPPPGCGGDRVRAGVQENENFVDFLLGERTWPKNVVLDTMQLARGYFFDIGERFSMAGLKGGQAGLLSWQKSTALNSLRMSMLNSLAARRAPTSSATEEVLEVMLRNFAVDSKVSGMNYESICSKAAPGNYLEAYVCNMTNIPSKANAPRIMGQASIDRIMQHDFYLSPIFYNAIVNSTTDPSVSLKRMKVFMRAQQLSQDYYFLRMLQMQTAASALQVLR